MEEAQPVDHLYPFEVVVGKWFNSYPPKEGPILGRNYVAYCAVRNEDINFVKNLKDRLHKPRNPAVVHPLGTWHSPPETACIMIYHRETEKIPQKPIVVRAYVDDQRDSGNVLSLIYLPAVEGEESTSEQMEGQ